MVWSPRQLSDDEPVTEKIATEETAAATDDLTSQVVANAQLAKKKKQMVMQALKDPESPTKVIQNAIALTRATSGKFKKNVTMGVWPFSQIADAAAGAYTAVKDKAVELVTGVSPSSIEASQRVAEAQQKMIEERVKAGTMDAAQGAQLIATTTAAATDAQEASKASNVLRDAGTIATNSTLKALGLPEIPQMKKYIKWGLVVAVVGGVVYLLRRPIFNTVLEVQRYLKMKSSTA
jgi:hypothetical protein